MRQRSETWQTLAADGEFRLETVAVIGGVEYSTITAPIITSGLLPDKTLSVGNCIASTLKFTLMTTDTIPKSAEIIIKCRLTDDAGLISEWLEFGHFWVDTRKTNDDLIDFVCYDAMLKGNQPYVDDSQAMVWPKPMSTVVNRIAEQMGVTVDSRTYIKDGSDYVVTLPDDEMTLLDILGHIGALHGGNWIITPENKLRLVQVSFPTSSYNVVDDDGNAVISEEGDNIVWRQPPSVGEVDIPVVIGEITTATPYTVSRITIEVDRETVYTAGDDTGVELKIESNPYATQTICEQLLGELYGLVYAPYEMSGACFDPAAELGDWVIAGDRITSVMYTATHTLDLFYSVDISAPGEDELESEYPFKSAVKKTLYTLESDNKKIRSEIRQTQDSILLKVDADGVIAAINASVEEDGSGSYVKISADKLNLSGYVTASSLRNPGQSIIDGSNITTGIIQDEDGNVVFDLTEGKLNVNKGSINLGGGKFVVDSEGNLRATSADIYGVIHSENEDTEFIEISSATITGGEGPYTYGRIGFLGVTDVDFGNRYNGPLIESDRFNGSTLFISTGVLAVEADVDGSRTYWRTGFTGQLELSGSATFVDESGRQTTQRILDFQNGLLIDPNGDLNVSR